jgi:hypothetical protein
MKYSKALLLFFLVILAAPLAGVDTAFWQMGTFEEFLKGTLHNVSLSNEGALTLAPEAQAVFNPEETVALSLTADRNHNLYVGTGHQGKVFRVDSNLKSSLVFTAQEPDIFALTTAPDGTLYVGSSPEGKIYRVTPDGRASVFQDPRAKYIWALALDAKGNLYAGTGDQGKILKIDPSGKGEVFFDSKQTHIMCLAFDREGNLLAGSVPDGLVYRINPEGKAFVLYQADLPEIHDLVTDSQGRIYAAALGGIGKKGPPSLFAPPTTGIIIPSTVTTVTVTAGSEDASKTPKEEQAPPVAPSGAPSFNLRPSPIVPLTMPKFPQGQGALIQISPNHSVETVWSSKDESIFGLTLRGDDVLFSTDSNGRVFELAPSPDGERLTLLTQTEESLATRLLLQGNDLYIATSNVARLFRLGAKLGKEGSYESPVKDTKFVSRWGELAWRADVPPGCALDLYSRAGNSERPDGTWSAWAGPYHNPRGTPILSPSARYLQWKAVFHSSGAGRPALEEVTVAYLNQNLPPEVRSVKVSTSSERTSPNAAVSIPSTSTTPTITVSASSQASLSSSSSGPGGATKTPTTLTWQADDPNGDQLVYSVYLQAADEQEWHLLKDKLQQTSYTVDPDALPDGKYVARVVASDEPSNPPAAARRAELVSAPFWIDNSPPGVRVVKQEVRASGAEVQFQVEDTTSPLESAQTATDGGDWQDIYSEDGIVDSRQETFTVKVDKLAPGEHIVTLRAYDTAGNAGVGKAVIRIRAEGRPAQ